MRATEFLTELFSSKKDWDWIKHRPNEVIAAFEVGGIPYRFLAYCEDMNGEGPWEVEFKNASSQQTSKFGLTGTGNSAEVMSTVVDIMRSFLKQNKDKVTELVFTAKEDSRQGLYARMVQRLLPDWDLDQAGDTFFLTPPNQVDEEMIHHPEHQFTTAYHITGTENAQEILHGGLDPYDGKAFMVVDEGDKAKLRDDLHTVGNWMYAKSEGSDDPLTLLQIDITNLPLAYEFGWYFSTTKIPPNRIKDLGEDVLARYV